MVLITPAGCLLSLEVAQTISFDGQGPSQETHTHHHNSGHGGEPTCMVIRPYLVGSEDGKVFTTGQVMYNTWKVKEYHTRVVMPNRNVSVTANYATLTTDMKLTLVKIMGAQKEKLYIYTCPPKNEMKGLIFSWHQWQCCQYYF